ncbi:hypothetical protein GCM10010082_05840 [Kushneria pakistanensis]|uniref:Uncharacterized protein n=1 Tax=Kushneria pakistanensis TaxID=1508770 RepID=A0ABQ3FBR5_9GAMM|nr:hypothetical protein [Kushneria pakistanensis]GHC17481.1 hypothetical protein GCM10010082_05840 [Kushneria pakistanensis]
MLKAVFAFIPLLAGYLFVTTLHETRFHIRRQNSQAVYFYAAFAGIVLLLFCTALTWWFREGLEPLTSFLRNWADENLPLETQERESSTGYWLVTLVLTLLSGFGLSYFFNLLQGMWTLLFEKTDQLIALAVNGIRRNKWNLLRYCNILSLTRIFYAYSSHAPLRRAVRRMNADFEEILLRAEDSSMGVMFSMRSGKVYVGMIVGAVDPSDSRDMIRIFPLISGYRQNETLKVNFTTFYYKLYEKMRNEGQLPHLTPAIFEIAFCFSDVQSATLFDIEAYIEFQRDKSESSY